MVNVTNKSGEIIASVKYNSDLDRWDGHNWTSGIPGHHIGITKLEDGSFVLIYGSQWMGQEDSAEVVSDEEALQAILSSGNTELLDDDRFNELRKLKDKVLIKEI